jgi:hypothetical protein
MEFEKYGIEEVHKIFEWHEMKRIEKLKELKNIEINKEWYFLTINPRPEITLKEFMKTIQKAVLKRWITYYIFVIEQRGENEEELGKGFHTHIIFNKGIKHCKVVLEMSNTFKKMCDTSNFHLFNLKNIGDLEKQRKIEYITGTKADEAKHLKQQMDIIFRKKENLKSYYISEETLENAAQRNV